MDKLIDKIYQKISNKIKRRLNTQEHIYVLKSIKNLDINKYSNLDDVAIILADILSETINKLYIHPDASSAQSSGIDMHEFLKKEIDTTEQIYINKLDSQSSQSCPSEQIYSSVSIYDANIIQLFNLLTTQDIINVINPASNYEKESIVLDSRYAHPSSNGVEWKWDYVPLKNITDYSVNTLGNIRNLIGIKLYSLTIPDSPDIDAAPGFISMLIDEFSSQSFQTNSSRQYHFLLNKVPHLYNTYYVELITADNGNGIFHFDPPIAEFTTLTITFANPNSLCSLTHPFLAESRFIIPLELTYLKNSS